MASDDAIDELAESIGFEPERTVYGGSSIGEDMAAALGTGNGFRFPSIEDANKIINSFKDRRDSMERRKQLISRIELALMRRFSEDDASIGYLQRAMESLDSLDTLNQSAIEYSERYIQKIEEAKRVKMEAEDEAASGFDKAVGPS